MGKLYINHACIHTYTSPAASDQRTISLPYILLIRANVPTAFVPLFSWWMEINVCFFFQTLNIIIWAKKCAYVVRLPAWINHFISNIKKPKLVFARIVFGTAQRAGLERHAYRRFTLIECSYEIYSFSQFYGQFVSNTN